MLKNKKILIIQTAFLGDVILALPMVQTLKQRMPDAKIDFLCIPQTADVLTGHPDINRVIPYDKKGGDKLDKFIEVLSEIREVEYDIVFCPHRFSRSALLTYYSEAKVRIGFDKNSFSFLLTRKVRYVQEKHEIHRNLDLVEALPGGEYDLSKVSMKPNLYPSEEDRKQAEKLLHRSNLIAFAPCSRWFTKQLSSDRSRELIRKLIFEGYNVVLLGSQSDENYCRKLEEQTGDSSLVNLCGKLSPLQSYHAITRSKALITVDSAVQHLGAASNTPIVLIYGSTDKRFGFYPLTSKNTIIGNNTLDCRPCTDHGRDSCPKGHFKCIEDLKTDEIFKKMEELMR